MAIKPQPRPQPEPLWCVVCFQEPIVRNGGPTVVAESYPGLVCRSTTKAWQSFLSLMNMEDTRANRAKWRAKGWRLSRVVVSVRLPEMAG